VEQKAISNRFQYIERTLVAELGEPLPPKQAISLMQTPFKFFISCLFCFALSLLSGCGSGLTTAERAEQAETEKKAKKEVAFTYVRMLAEVVDQYALDMGQPPTNKQGLQALIACPTDVPNPGAYGGPYIKDIATSRDPWGSDYQYASPGTRSNGSFNIWSYGPDMRDGTADDIGN
jgi:general secretion pathway protein G